VRVATWNVNSVKARLPRLLQWLAEAEPDVVGLQETKVTADGFPSAEVEELGYEVAANGEGRWNGVALLSRVGLEQVSLGFPGAPSYQGEPDGAVLLDDPGLRRPEARAVAADCGGLRAWSLYVPNGRTVGSAHYEYKLSWFAALRDALAAELSAQPALVAMGDFNVAPADGDVVPRPMKGPHPFTYWDYRAGAFAKDMGMRIDLFYATAAVADRVRGAYVDREARKGHGPSDHAPVVVDLD
jgi:exodeoxyribonuclease-3